MFQNLLFLISFGIRLYFFIMWTVYLFRNDIKRIAHKAHQSFIINHSMWLRYSKKRAKTSAPPPQQNHLYDK